MLYDASLSHLQSHAACYLSVPAECSLGRLRCMLLHPAFVRLDSRNFSKMHCYRISESCSHDPGTHTPPSRNRSLQK